MIETTWHRLAVRSMETAFAAGVVIQARMLRMATASWPLAPPDERGFRRMSKENERELRRMTDEKTQAYTRAWLAIGFAAFTAGARLAQLMLAQATPMTTGTRRSHRAATSRIERHVSASAARIAHRGLTPIRAAATANAQRLRKKTR